MKKWILAGLAAGLLIVALTGGALMASGGYPDKPEGNEAPEEVIVKDVETSTASVVNDDLDASGEPDELAVRVAELLGMDSQATYDAMVQADAAAEPIQGWSGEEDEGERAADSMSVEAEGPSYLEYGNRVGAILGLDGLSVAEAIAQAYEQLYAVERGISDNGRGWDREGREDSGKRSVGPDTDG